MTGWLFPLRPLQQSQSRDNLRLLPPLPSSRWSDHGPYHPGERAIYVPKLSGLPGDPNYRGPDQRGSAVMKRHWVTEWGAPQTEEALGYRIRGTTNWRGIGLQNEGHHKLKRHWVTEWGAPETEEAMGYRMRDTTNWSKLTDNLDESKFEVQTWRISVRFTYSVTGIQTWVHEHHVTPCSVSGGYQGCGDVYCLHFYSDLEKVCRNAGVSPKLHDVAIRIARIQIFIVENFRKRIHIYIYIYISSVYLSY